MLYISETTELPYLTRQNTLSIDLKALQRLKIRVRQFIEVEKYEAAEHNSWLQNFAVDIARTKENTIDIINAMIEILIKESIALPPFSTLDRIAYYSRSASNKANYSKIYDVLSEKSRSMMDSLLVDLNPDKTTKWHSLKEEPKKLSSRTLLHFHTHARWIRSLQNTIGLLPEIPEVKRIQLVYEAKAYTSNRMKRVEKYKRYSLIALLIQEQFYYCTDCIVEMFIREVRKIHNRAKQDMETFRNKMAVESESLVLLLRDIAQIYIDESEASRQQTKIRDLLKDKPKNVVERCNKLVFYGLNNHLQFLEKGYTHVLRRGLLNCLSYLEIDHTAHGGDLLKCLNTVLRYCDDKMYSIAVSEIDPDNTSETTAVDWISNNWSKLLFDSTRKKTINRMMNRKYFELSVFTEIGKRLQSRDIYVKNSTKYDDYKTHLVSVEEYQELVDEFTVLVGLILW